ncbi:aldehyde dehydrogenase family-domain-containing protein [Russula emetica]|nr:aldehyde dehydrogenase family-domain-containing protein [Russula emetica]
MAIWPSGLRRWNQVESDSAISSPKGRGQENYGAYNRCIFERGGKSPSVVLADTDIEQASRAIVGFFYSGQCGYRARDCTTTSSLVFAIKQHLSTLAVGDPENSEHSSLFTERNADDIITMVKEAKEAAAEVLLGGVEKAGPTLLKPHILLGVKPETRL